MKAKAYRILFGIFLIGILIENVCAGVRIDSVSFDPAQIEAGNEVDIYLKFHESPTERDVWAGVTPGYGEKGIVREKSDVFYKAKLVPVDDITKTYVIIAKETKNVGHLFTGETWTTPFRVKIREDAPATNYAVEFQILETDAEGVGEEIVRSHRFDIPVRGTINLNVESNTTINLGTVNDVEISVTNNGGGIARHVTISPNVTGNVRALETSAIYVGEIGGVEKKVVNMKLFVSGNAETGAYSLPIEMDYANSSGHTIHKKQNIGLWINGEPDIDVILDTTGLFTKGLSGSVTIGVINQGFVDAKFLKLELLPGEGYEVTSIGSFYIGSLSSDDTDSEDFEIKVSDGAKEGKVPLNVRVTYKCENKDVLFTKESDVYINVLSGEEYANKVGGRGRFSTIGILLAIPVLIIVYLVLWFIYKLVNMITAYLNTKIFKRV